MFVSFLSDINSPALPQQRQRGGYRWVWRNNGRRLIAVPWRKHCQPRGCWAGNGVDWFGGGGQRGICLNVSLGGCRLSGLAGWLAGLASLQMEHVSSNWSILPETTLVPQNRRFPFADWSIRAGHLWQTVTSHWFLSRGNSENVFLLAFVFPWFPCFTTEP